MGEEFKQRRIEYESNRSMSVSLQVLSYLLQPGSNPETVYGAPVDAEIIGISFDPDRAMIVLTFDRPVPPLARFRESRNPRAPKQFGRRPVE